MKQRTIHKGVWMRRSDYPLTSINLYFWPRRSCGWRFLIGYFPLNALHLILFFVEDSDTQWSSALRRKNLGQVLPASWPRTLSWGAASTNDPEKRQTFSHTKKRLANGNLDIQLVEFTLSIRKSPSWKLKVRNRKFNEMQPYQLIR